MNTQIFPRTEAQQLELKAEQTALQGRWAHASIEYAHAMMFEPRANESGLLSRRSFLADRAACRVLDQGLAGTVFIAVIEDGQNYALIRQADGHVITRNLDLHPAQTAACRLNATMAEQVRALRTANQELMAKVLTGIKPQEAITWNQVAPGKWVAELEHDTRAVVYDGAPSDNVTELRFEAHYAVCPTTAAVFLSAEDARAQMIPFFVRWRIHCRAMKSFAARNWQAGEPEEARS